MQWLIRHAMRALYPRTDELPGIEDTGDVAFLAQYRRETSFLMWLGLVAGTALFVMSPLVTIFVPLPSFLLPKKLLDRHASRVASSGIYLLRQSVFLLKLTAGLCWGSHPDVRAKLAMQPYEPDPEEWRTT